MSWPAYFDKIKDMPPRPLLLKALDVVPESLSKTAVEFGSGVGTDARYLLNTGWRVTAVEKDIAGVEYFKSTLTPEIAKNLNLVHSAFEDLQGCSEYFGPVSLIYASLSLPFCRKDHFSQLWSMIEFCFAEHCVFAAQFFGPEDDWVKAGQCTGHTEDEVRGLLKGFSEVTLSEYKKRGPTALNGEKFWHIYDVIAKR